MVKSANRLPMIGGQTDGSPMPGTLFVVATPIGNLEDITLRALRTLREVSLIAAEDTRRTARLLSRFDIRTPLVSLHEHNEAAEVPGLLGRLRAGDSIAVTSDAGTPLLSDPGALLVREALASGIRVEAIPGPSAVLTALVSSGLPADTFTFLGFPPARGAARQRWLGALAAEQRTVVFFEAPHRVRETVAEVAALLGERAVAIARELTKSTRRSSGVLWPQSSSRSATLGASTRSSSPLPRPPMCPRPCSPTSRRCVTSSRCPPRMRRAGARP